MAAHQCMAAAAAISTFKVAGSHHPSLRPAPAYKRVAKKINIITCHAPGQPTPDLPIKPQLKTSPRCSHEEEVRPVPASKRQLISSLLLLGAFAPSVAGSFWPGSDLLAELAPLTSDSVNAKDENGRDIIAVEWVKSHPAGDHTVAQGSPDGPIYLVINNDGTLANYGINAICTHMGCVVPWNAEENKFMCPCHGSQYDFRGQVVQGPAPLSLALAHIDVVNDKVVFSPWLEKDFRDGEAPWWAED